MASLMCMLRMAIMTGIAVEDMGKAYLKGQAGPVRWPPAASEKTLVASASTPPPLLAADKPRSISSAEPTPAVTSVPPGPSIFAAQATTYPSYPLTKINPTAHISRVPAQASQPVVNAPEIEQATPAIVVHLPKFEINGEAKTTAPMCGPMPPIDMDNYSRLEYDQIEAATEKYVDGPALSQTWSSSPTEARIKFPES